MEFLKIIFVLITVLLLPACQTGIANQFESSNQHLTLSQQAPISQQIPSLLHYIPYWPEAQTTTFESSTYSVEAEQVSISDILFELSKDAKINLDIHGDLSKKITINIIDQTIDKILSRLQSQGVLRYEISKNHIDIYADLYYQKNYTVSYLNTNRQAKGYVSLSLNLDNAAKGSENDLDNRSIMKVQSHSENNFWKELEQTLNALISKEESFVINPSTGIISVTAKSNTHNIIDEYINVTIKQSHQQVLVEATILEVNLNHDSNTGIDWHRLANFDEWAISNNFVDPDLNSSDQLFSLTYQNEKGNFSSTIKLLEEFGEVRVLSSPKIMAINNQPSILKVVDNRVYFTLDVDTSTASGGATQTSVETTVNTIPVGFSMSLTPFISEKEEVLLNIRPSISRIVRFVNDPSPLLAEQNIVSAIPEVQVREMETVLKLKNGQLAVLGGLMQDTYQSNISQIPKVGSIPVAGELFKGKNKKNQTSELLILLKPKIINMDETEKTKDNAYRM